MTGSERIVVRGLVQPGNGARRAVKKRDLVGEGIAEAVGWLLVRIVG